MFGIKEFIDNIFNNPPIDVCLPRAFTVFYRDVGKRVEAYTVEVTYKNDKHKEFTFPVDNDHWQLVSSDRAYKRAMCFYRRQRAKVRAYQRLHRNENSK